MARTFFRRMTQAKEAPLRPFVFLFWFCIVVVIDWRVVEVVRIVVLDWW